eukprot:scaffold3602_cov66-Cyclotella_meneghiniana.AAC.2
MATSTTTPSAPTRRLHPSSPPPPPPCVVLSPLQHWVLQPKQLPRFVLLRRHRCCCCDPLLTSSPADQQSAYPRQSQSYQRDHYPWQLNAQTIQHTGH